MGDTIFQNNNQNSVYVLNSNCRIYEEFAPLNFINSNNSTNVPKCQHLLTSISGHRCCSACTQAFQNTLRNLGNYYDVTETIGNPVTTSPPLLSPTAAHTTALTQTATSCLPPAAAAFQKLFNCSYVTNVSGGNSVNALHCEGFCEGGDVKTAIATCKIKSNNNNKKSSYVKPSLIAKKTKFLKFIEKEKWNTCAGGVSNNEPQKLCTNNNGRIDCSGLTTPDKLCANSCVKESNVVESTALTTTTAATETCGPLSNIVKNYWNGKTDSNDAGSGKKRHQSKSNNWSGNFDTSNQQQEHLQMLKSSQQKQKSNYELYKEAAELLGLSCTLCDNCRCLECQSSYFDCDDSDSFSELSNSDEYDEEALNTFNNPVERVMYVNCYSDDATTKQYKSHQQHTTAHKLHEEPQRKANFKCADANCNLTELLRDGRGSSKLSDNDDNEVISGTRQTDANKSTEMQLTPNQKNEELETYTSLSGLRLTDAEGEPLGCQR